MKKEKEIGIEAKSPAKKCEDKKCPYHGAIKLRGRQFLGKVISKDVHRTANIQWEFQEKLKKYERYKKRISKVKAHNPSCIDAEVGDIVKIVETRPISKTKKFVVVEVAKK